MKFAIYQYFGRTLYRDAAINFYNTSTLWKQLPNSQTMKQSITSCDLPAADSGEGCNTFRGCVSVPQILLLPEKQQIQQLVLWQGYLLLSLAKKLDSVVNCTLQVELKWLAEDL